MRFPWHSLAHARSTIALLAVLGCGQTARNHPSGEQHLRVDLDSEHVGVCSNDPADIEHTTWNVVADLDLQSSSVSGWIALTGFETSTGSARYTVGSSPVSGSRAGDHIELDPGQFDTADGRVAFDTLTLDYDGNGAFTGQASGQLHFQFGDMMCEPTYTAAVTARPDDEAPTLSWLDEGTVLLPFDSVRLRATEPFRVSPAPETRVTGGDATSEITASVRDDTRSGYAIGLEFLPSSGWPPGDSLSFDVDGLLDPAGNTSPQHVGPFPIRPRPVPDASDNPGFESALDGWITDPSSAIYVTPSVPDRPDITAPEGSKMAEIDSDGARLIGYLVPPAGASRLCMLLGSLDSAVVDLLKSGQGVAVDFVSGTSRHTVITGGDLAIPEQQDATWSGFTRACAAIPNDGAGGFWVVITPTGSAPPLHFPRMVVDALSFE